MSRTQHVTRVLATALLLSASRRPRTVHVSYRLPVCLSVCLPVCLCVLLVPNIGLYTSDCRKLHQRRPRQQDTQTDRQTEHTQQLE